MPSFLLALPGRVLPDVLAEAALAGTAHDAAAWLLGLAALTGLMALLAWNRLRGRSARRCRCCGAPLHGALVARCPVCGETL